MHSTVGSKGSRKRISPLMARPLMARPLPPPPLNDLAISGGTFFPASLRDRSAKTMYVEKFNI